MKDLATPEEFQQVLANNAKQGSSTSTSSALMLVCYDSSAKKEGTIEKSLKDKVAEAERKAQGKIEFASFDTNKAPAIRGTLGIEKHPVIFAVRGGNFLDKLEGLQDCVNTVVPFTKKFVDFLQPPQRNEGSLMQIDISKLLNNGNDLLRKGQPMYAEKFFLKALALLNAVTEDAPATGNEDIDGSLSMCLASLTIARCVQGKVTECADTHRRMTAELSKFSQERGSVAARSVALFDMLYTAPFKYVGEECSEKKLRELLKSDPKNYTARGQLCTTCFLSGKLEEAITEGLKLVQSGESKYEEYGTTAMDAIVSFLHSDDPLVVQSGWLSRGNKESTSSS